MKSLTVLAVLVALPIAAHAETCIGTSIEWLVVSSPHIAIVAVDASGTVKTEVLRGAPPEIAGFAGALPARQLFFYDAGRNATALNLLDEQREDVITTDFRVLKTEKEILERVRARIARAEKETVHGSFKVEVPADTPAHKSLYAGSACYLVVPAAPEHRPRFVEQLRAENVQVRARAAWLLRRYPGDETVALLKAALADPGTAVVRVHDGKRLVDVTTWPVRQGAYDALALLGVEVPKPAGWRAEDALHPLDQ